MVNQQNPTKMWKKMMCFFFGWKMTKYACGDHHEFSSKRPGDAMETAGLGEGRGSRTL